MSVNTAVKATMSEAIQPASATLTVTGPGATPVAGTTTYNAATRQVVFTPDAALPAGTIFTATLSGAMDLAGNTMTSPVTWTFTTSGTAACPCTLWSTDTTPAVTAATDAREVELGVRFSADTDGWISGVRFYKGTTNTGIHTGSLWTSGGTLLSTTTFSGESASGWQQASFPAPIHITAGLTYIASYHAPAGHYAADTLYFVSPTDNAPLHAPASIVGAGNGVFRYGTTAFPTSTSNSTNYWVDVAFSTTAPPDVVPPTVTAFDPVNGTTSVAPSATFKATFSEAMDPTSLVFTVTGPTGAVAGTTSYDSTTHVATLTPGAPLADLSLYTATVSAGNDVAGNPLTAPASTTVRSAEPTAAVGTCPCLIWPDAVGPAQPATTDSQAVEVGTKFRADTNGFITGIRFYKGASNTGSHTGTLWDNAGNALATGTFTGESVAGWQQLTFANPVAITAGTTYIASYHTPSGHYAATVNGFLSAGVDRGVLHALKTGVDGPDGVFTYGAGGIVPATGTASNYWVQPVYVTVLSGAPTDAPTGVGATSGNASATVTWVAPTSNTGLPITGYVVTPYIGAAAQTPQTFASTALTQVATGLTNGTAYTFTVAAINGAGTGPESLSSSAVTPDTVAGAPTGVTATAGDASATVTWAAPCREHRLSHHRLHRHPLHRRRRPDPQTFASTALTQTVTGLTNGTAYTFTVAAINGAGTGPESLSSTAVTPDTVAGAPTGVTATAGDASATVAWVAPSNAGSAITGYTVTPYIGAVAQTPQTFASTALTQVVTGLTNGTTYTFTVAATNGAGTGPESLSSTPVTPDTLAGAPTGVTATAGNASATITWAAPCLTPAPPSPATPSPPTSAPPPSPPSRSTSTALTQVVTGLTNGTTYTFTVAAINGAGTGPESLPSSAVTPDTVAGAPTGVTATAGDASATVVWVGAHQQRLSHHRLHHHPLHQRHRPSLPAVPLHLAVAGRHRAHQRHHLHLHRRRHQRRRHRPRVPAQQRGHARHRGRRAHRRDRHRRRRLGDGGVGGAHQQRLSHHRLHHHPLHQRHRPSLPDVPLHLAVAGRHRADQRHHLHLHRRRHQRRRHRPRVPAQQRRHARHRGRRAHRRDRHRRRHLGDGGVGGAHQQRLSHHRLHHHPLHRRRRSTSPDVPLHVAVTGRHRAHQRHHLHLHRRRHQRRRHRPRVGAQHRRHPRHRGRRAHRRDRHPRQRLRHRHLGRPCRATPARPSPATPSPRTSTAPPRRPRPSRPPPSPRRSPGSPTAPPTPSPSPPPTAPAPAPNPCPAAPRPPGHRSLRPRRRRHRGTPRPPSRGWPPPPTTARPSPATRSPPSSTAWPERPGRSRRPP